MPIYKADGKKDGLQKYNVRVNYISDDGKQKQLTRTIYGSEAARDLERHLINEIKVKGENTVKKMTVQQLFEKYKLVKESEIRETTFDKYVRNYGQYVQPTMADLRLDKLTVAILQDWKLFIEKKGLSLKTKKHAYSTFRGLLNFAVKMEYIDGNPLSKVGNFRDSWIGKTEMSIYTAQEFMQYITTAKKIAEEKQNNEHNLSEWEYYVFFCIAFYTGLRKGEIHALKHSDINGSLLSVDRSISQKLRGADRETPPKNKASVRTIQLPLPLIQILNEHKKRHEMQKNFTEDYRVCGGEKCLRDTTLQNRNLTYAVQSGLMKIRIHDFRHSHVSILANEGINIQEIARRLGHSRVEMTWNTYSHLYPREEEKAVDVLNKIA